MVHTIIWLTLLGIALLLPNVLAIRFALFGGQGLVEAVVAGEGGVVAAPAPVAKAKGRGLKFARGGYLWKALSPLLLGMLAIIGIALGGPVGYGLMGLGLLNAIVAFIGWDSYVPGRK